MKCRLTKPHCHLSNRVWSLLMCTTIEHINICSLWAKTCGSPWDNKCHKPAIVFFSYHAFLVSPSETGVPKNCNNDNHIPYSTMSTANFWAKAHFWRKPKDTHPCKLPTQRDTSQAGRDRACTLQRGLCSGIAHIPPRAGPPGPRRTGRQGHFV